MKTTVLIQLNLQLFVSVYVCTLLIEELINRGKLIHTNFRSVMYVCILSLDKSI